MSSPESLRKPDLCSADKRSKLKAAEGDLVEADQLPDLDTKRLRRHVKSAVRMCRDAIRDVQTDRSAVEEWFGRVVRLEKAIL